MVTPTDMKQKILLFVLLTTIFSSIIFLDQSVEAGKDKDKENKKTNKEQGEMIKN